MKIDVAGPTDLHAIRPLLAAANRAPYDLAAVAVEKCFGPGFHGPAVVRVIRRESEIAGISVTSGRHLRLLAVLPTLRRQGLGSALLAEAEERIQNEGAGEMEAAAEAGNYFTPGIWEEDRETIAFLSNRGFVESDHATNLIVDLISNPLIQDVSHPSIERGSAGTRERILEFVESHFGKIWRFEIEPAFRDPSPPLFFATEHGAIAGFSAHDVNNRGLGFFGPEGIDTSRRGRGFGKALLLASLADLRRRGYRQAVIPWASSPGFYTKTCGARPAHRFVILRKRLTGSR